MILIDTRVVVGWLDPGHPTHKSCLRTLDACAAVDELAVSSLTIAELAAGGRREQDLMEDLKGFQVVALDKDAAIYGGREFSRQMPGRQKQGLGLSDFLLFSQAAKLEVPILTLNHPGLRAVRNVDILVPEK